MAKAGLTLAATFNYQVLPEVTTEVCYKDSTIKVKNCIGVYHQWADNTLELYAWYAWRGTCKYGWVKLVSGQGVFLLAITPIMFLCSVSHVLAVMPTRT